MSTLLFLSSFIKFCSIFIVWMPTTYTNHIFFSAGNRKTNKQIKTSKIDKELVEPRKCIINKSAKMSDDNKLSSRELMMSNWNRQGAFEYSLISDLRELYFTKWYINYDKNYRKSWGSSSVSKTSNIQAWITGTYAQHLNKMLRLVVPAWNPAMGKWSQEDPWNSWARQLRWIGNLYVPVRDNCLQTSKQTKKQANKHMK